MLGCKPLNIPTEDNIHQVLDALADIAVWYEGLCLLLPVAKSKDSYKTTPPQSASLLGKKLTSPHAECTTKNLLEWQTSVNKCRHPKVTCTGQRGTHKRSIPERSFLKAISERMAVTSHRSGLLLWNSQTGAHSRHGFRDHSSSKFFAHARYTPLSYGIWHLWRRTRIHAMPRQNLGRVCRGLGLGLVSLSVLYVLPP